MQDTPSSEGDIIEYNEALEKGKEVLSAPLYEDSEYSNVYLNVEKYLHFTNCLHKYIVYYINNINSLENVHTNQIIFLHIAVNQ